MTTNKSVSIHDLVASMTIQEKVAQLLQIAPHLFNSETKGEITGPLAEMAEMGLQAEDVKAAGSVLGISGAEEMIQLQKTYLENSDKKIPLLIMADIIHGYRTIFPIPLGLSCSWDLELAEKTAEVAAKEASAGGVHVTFSPMVDLVRDPRWGRVMESTGESAHLNSEFARAFVRGYQGEDLSDYERLAACVKHFAAYGAAEAGRDYNTVDMSERILRESYLPAYKAALDEGCKMVMTSFNTVNSVPPSGNTWLMRDLLREEWGFDGVVISDWGAVKELIPHGVAEDMKEAAKKSITAGVDIEMMTTCYTTHLEQLIKDGIVSEALLDEAVLRILQLKEELGLFENPYRGADPEKEAALVVCEDHRKVAREAAAKSIVLLKNEGVLPLSKNTGKVGIFGPFADNPEINGGWSWQGKFEENITIKQGVINKIDSEHVVVAKGCGFEDGSDEELQEAINLAETCDTIILALGEHHDMSGEGGSRTNIKLPGRQLELAKELAKLEKPMVVVLINGRPLDVAELFDVAPAAVEAWFPGTEGGNSVADILFGDYNPSARLTMSFPQTVGQIPVYHDSFNTGRPKQFESNPDRFTSHFLDCPNAPFLPFGFGLSYTTFTYSDFQLSDTQLTADGSIKASVKVKNTGHVSGDETVQLYIRDVAGSVVRPVMELKDFRKISLAPQEEKIVEFTITEEMLRYYNIELAYTSEPGTFIAMVGPHAGNVQNLEFKLQ
ncbi:glycoside hydrolase family 3 N-terminal domain-containing protein [Bacillus sp. JJ722]|uniref:glycoside hydrolase family 3 N-terminal domain-containing protein n=1 Tax=Bacillus sp. JJ722 TaxID=3122973 RepID=UPI002FFF8DD8